MSRTQKFKLIIINYIPTYFYVLTIQLKLVYRYMDHVTTKRSVQTYLTVHYIIVLFIKI